MVRSLGFTGHCHSMISKRKISSKVSGSLNGMWGKKHSKKTKDRIGESSCGRIPSRETREKMRNAHLGIKNPAFGRSGTQNHMFGRVAYPKLEFDRGLGHSVRSSWELIICKFLRAHKIFYAYEAVAFQIESEGKKQTYTPDLRLQGDLFVEIKGPFPIWQKAKLKCFLAQWPQITLILLIPVSRYDLSMLIGFPNLKIIDYPHKNWEPQLLAIAHAGGTR